MKDVSESTKSLAQKALYAKASELLRLIDTEYASNNDYVIKALCPVSGSVGGRQ